MPNSEVQTELILAQHDPLVSPNSSRLLSERIAETVEVGGLTFLPGDTIAVIIETGANVSLSLVVEVNQRVLSGESVDEIMGELCGLQNLIPVNKLSSTADRHTFFIAEQARELALVQNQILSPRGLKLDLILEHGISQDARMLIDIRHNLYAKAYGDFLNSIGFKDFEKTLGFQEAKAVNFAIGTAVRDLNTLELFDLAKKRGDKVVIAQFGIGHSVLGEQLGLQAGGNCSFNLTKYEDGFCLDPISPVIIDLEEKILRVMIERGWSKLGLKEVFAIEQEKLLHIDRVLLENSLLEELVMFVLGEASGVDSENLILGFENKAYKWVKEYRCLQLKNVGETPDTLFKSILANQNQIREAFRNEVVLNDHS